LWTQLLEQAQAQVVLVLMPTKVQILLRVLRVLLPLWVPHLHTDHPLHVLCLLAPVLNQG
jgi:hypothetical protein